MKENFSFELYYKTCNKKKTINLIALVANFSPSFLAQHQLRYACRQFSSHQRVYRQLEKKSNLFGSTLRDYFSGFHFYSLYQSYCNCLKTYLNSKGANKLCQSKNFKTVMRLLHGLMWLYNDKITTKSGKIGKNIKSHHKNV